MTQLVYKVVRLSRFGRVSAVRTPGRVFYLIDQWIRPPFGRFFVFRSERMARPFAALLATRGFGINGEPCSTVELWAADAVGVTRVEGCADPAYTNTVAGLRRWWNRRGFSCSYKATPAGTHRAYALRLRECVAVLHGARA